MKKKITLFALTCAFAAGASSQNEIVSTINSFNYEAGQSKPKNPNTIKRYFYDESNNNIAELNINNFENTKTDKVYNADGTLNTTFEYNKANKYTTFELTRKSIYTYDSNKKVAEIAIYDQNSDAPTGYMEYTYEAASENYIVRTLNADKSHASSTSKYEYGFNNDGKISFEIIRILNWSGTEYTPQQKTTYVYEEGKLISESVFARGWSGEEFQTSPKSIKTYTYENDLLVSDKKTEGEFIYENTYIYSNYSKDKNIINLKAEKVNSVDAAPNTVKLTWDAVNGVDGYSVYVDNVHTSVSSNECTLELLANGEHKAYIVAINDGKDAGYVGISEFSVKNEDMPKVSNIYVISCSKIEGPYSYTYEVKIGWDIPQSSTGILGYNTNCHNSKDMTINAILIDKIGSIDSDGVAIIQSTLLTDDWIISAGVTGKHEGQKVRPLSPQPSSNIGNLL